MRFLALCFLTLAFNANAAIQVTPRSIPRQWTVAEFSLTGVPSGGNVFDLDSVSVKGAFIAPSGKTNTVEAFWYRDYSSTLNNGAESLSAGGSEWRIRFLPDEAGVYTLNVTGTAAGVTQTGSLGFNVSIGAATNHFKTVPKIAANRRYFEVAGEPLVLNGANVCWHGGRGTFDYLDWFPAMQRNGENFARLWMCPWAFGIETDSNSRTNYNMSRAWQLDRVMRMAETNGIFIMLCLDYHGMYQTVIDNFGGNNLWTQNPYNTAFGGPCVNPNDYFTSLAAREIYKKRLRYIMARWGSSPNLLCYEFFNEIDNDYNVLNATDIANWHAALGPWLKANDPYKRLVTTSLTGSSDRPEIWNLPSMEFAQYHSYGLAQPASALPGIVRSMMTRYQKPVLVGEIGVDSSGFHAEKDPYFRGFRQGIWSGLLSGTPGTSMSWWWEEIHARNLYSIYDSAARFLGKSALGNGTWNEIKFLTSGEPPNTVGDQIPGAAAFSPTLTPNGQWGFLGGGYLAVTDSAAAERAPSVFNGFFHGTTHAELRNPCFISAWFTNNAKLVLHLNSVSDGAIINVRIDGATAAGISVPNKDGGYNVNNEYNTNYTVNITPGKHTIEVRNGGGDWFYLDWIRLENVQPSSYLSNWAPSPVAIGMKHAAESLLYVVNPAANFPANGTLATIPPMTNGAVRLTNWTTGEFTAIWSDAKTLAPRGKTSGITTNSVLELALPMFSEDLAGRIVPKNHISQLTSTNGTLAFRLDIPAAVGTSVERTTNFLNWITEAPVPFSTQSVNVPIDSEANAKFLRIAVPE